MDENSLRDSILQYELQLTQVNGALKSTPSGPDYDSLISLRSDLTQLVNLTKESLAALKGETCGNAGDEHETNKQNKSSFNSNQENNASENKTEQDNDPFADEYALFMSEMSKSGAYDDDKTKNTEANSCSNVVEDEASQADSDIDDELTSLPGMKCAAYHTHKWGGQPTLHNAMVCSVVPRDDSQQASFQDIQVRVMFTHPTHSEMLPCPFYLDGECKFSEEQCRFSHGEVAPLQSLKEALEPNYESLKVGSRVLLKLKCPNPEELIATKKSSEKYFLWQRGVVTSVNFDKKRCTARLESVQRGGGGRGASGDEVSLSFEDIFPLDASDQVYDSDSDQSLSDTEYAAVTTAGSHSCAAVSVSQQQQLLVDRSLASGNTGVPLGEWERYTKGIGSKIMFAMGYVAGTGLGSAGAGRLEPVAARVLPVGKSLDHCMKISEKMAGQDPLKVEQRLKRLQRKQEERNRRAFERQKEKEKHNVFNFLNHTLGDTRSKSDVPDKAIVETTANLKGSTSKNLNIEQFKIAEEKKKMERDIVKLKNSLFRHVQGSNMHKTIKNQMDHKWRELKDLKDREKAITNEQSVRSDKKKLTFF